MSSEYSIAKFAATPDVAPGYLLSRRATRLAFTGLMLAQFLVALNQTIVATAVPEIAADLGGLDQYSWVFSAYVLGSSVTIPLFGRLSDVHGRRPFFVAGLVLLIAGSVLGALAGSMAEVIVARAIQGLGGGAVLALVFTTIGDLVPPSDRGRWQALNGGVFAIASVLGPLAGGWIADNAAWRWVFVISIPVGVFALVLGGATLRIPPHPDRGRRVDYLGAVLLLGALGAVMLAVTEWGEGAAPGDRAVLLPFLGGVVLGFAFAAHERAQAGEAFVPIEVLGDRVVRLACLAGVLTGAAHFGAITYLPLFTQGALSASATATGVVLMGLMVAMFGMTMISGPAISHSGRYRWVLLGAPPTIGAGYGLLAALGVGAPVALATIAAVVLGGGLGLVSQNLMLVAQNSAPSRHLGSATGAVTCARNAGGAIGIAAMGAVLAANLPGAADVAVEGSVSDIAPAAYVSAFQPVFLVAVGLMIVAMAVLLRMPERMLRPSVRDDVSPTCPSALENPISSH